MWTNTIRVRVTMERLTEPHLLSHHLFVWQFAGDDAGVVSVRPEGRPGSVSAFLSESGAAAPAASGLPVC